ncbi:MAG: DEAD/DEAH box helicase, partial [Proteobacteria bacterium]|nr:DEAD/DEAH box helicase [Pseudomonadota bacterium]
MATIEPILLGKNVVLSAGTGTGKTEAIMAPLMAKYWREAVRTDLLTVIYIAPTKALVNDVERRLAGPLGTLGVAVGVRHGDRDDLAAGRRIHVLITTPESLEVLLFRRDDRLSGVRAIVIDEVHLLYNTQRGLQLAFLLNRLRTQTPDVLQTAALSATIASPEDIQTFFFGRDVEAQALTFSAHRPIDAHVRVITAERELVEFVKLMTDGPRAKLLMFADSRRECERLAGALTNGQCGSLEIFAHYSSLSAEVRVATEERFAASPKALCVATSTLELGIDIGDIDAVLLWGAPASVESFLQRIGRGNRRSHKTNVICLVPETAESPVREIVKFLALLDAARTGQLP